MLLLLLLPLVWSEDLATRGYDHFYNLEFDRAIELFSQRAGQAPNDPQAWNHVAHGILYREMLRSGALESELVTGSNPFLRRERLKPSLDDQSRFEDAIGKALALTEGGGDSGALYARGVSYGLRGNYNFLVRKAWLDALRDLTNARKLHARVVAMDPLRVDAKLVPGLHDYVVGSLPWAYKVLGFVAGFRGDREGGIRTLEEVAAEGGANRTDAEVLLAAVYRRERQPARAIPLVEALVRRYPRNYLFRLELVQMFSDSGDKEKALAELAALDALKVAGLRVERIQAARGTLLFWYREYQAAIQQLTAATRDGVALDGNTRSMAWLRLGQSYDMTGNRPGAIGAYERAVGVAPDSDAAREARGWSKKPYRRGPD